jgi:hypothetical protein
MRLTAMKLDILIRKIHSHLRQNSPIVIRQSVFLPQNSIWYTKIPSQDSPEVKPVIGNRSIIFICTRPRERVFPTNSGDSFPHIGRR